MKPRTCLILGVICLALAQGLVSSVLVDMRAQLVVNSDVYGALKPGEFAGTLMLGGFRGLACDLLWMRAENAKDKGSYYESLALAETITKIQPRFEQVWEYMSYDMAYNISHEIEDQQGQWAWYLAGVEINVRGIEHNPHSERLVRHLAWLFFHKGDTFHARVEEASWGSLINPVIALANQGIAAPDQVPLLPAGTGITCHRIAESLYRCAINVAHTHHLRILPFERRMIPITIDHDGNRLRNRGQHLAALRRYMDALNAWQEVLAESKLPASFGNDQQDQDISRDIAQHNDGRLQRKATLLVEELCLDPTLAAEVDRDIAQHRFLEAERLMEGPKWRTAESQIKNIRWLDEQ